MVNERSSRALNALSTQLLKLEKFLVERRPPLPSFVSYTLEDETDNRDDGAVDFYLGVDKLKGCWRLVYERQDAMGAPLTLIPASELSVAERMTLLEDAENWVPVLLKQFTKDENELPARLEKIVDSVQQVIADNS